MPLQLVSPSFAHNGAIPSKHTCDGVETSPALQWSGLPAGTRSLALIVDDPDAPDPAAPKRVWVHWVLYNLPADSTGLAEGVDAAQLPKGAKQALNDWERTGYGGPCPPIGRHRYFFKLYALDAELQDLGKGGKGELMAAMQGHVIGETELVGTYQRGGQ